MNFVLAPGRASGITHEELIRLAEETVLCGAPSGRTSRPDGPYEPNGFAWAGDEKTTTSNPAWKLINAMWGKTWRARGDVVKEVWGLNEDRADDTLHSTVSRANELLKAVNHPHILTYSATRSGFAWKPNPDLPPRG